MKQSVLLTVLLGLAFSLPARAQTPTSSDGTDFYIGYFAGGKAPGEPTAQRPSIAAMVGAYAVDTVIFSYFDETTGAEFVQNQIVMQPHTTLMQPLDPDILLGRRPGIQFADVDTMPRYSSYHIRSSSPISVQVYGAQPNCTELYLALPTDILGTEYTAVTHANERAIDNDPERYPVIEVISIRDSTLVDIQPSCPTRFPISGQITLMRGQVYRIHSAHPYQEDLTGTIIRSSYPVVVISGHEGASLPTLNGIRRYSTKYDNVQNPLIEQLRPMNYWVDEGYFGVPLAPVPPNTVYADFPGCRYRITNTPQGPDSVFAASLQSVRHEKIPGAFLNLDSMTVPVEFFNTRQQPMDCQQLDYYRGVFESGVTFGYSAPFMMNVIPKAQWKSEYLFHVPASSDYHSQYLGIVYSQASPPTIKHNGNIVPYAQPSSLFYKNYPNLRCAVVKIQPGTYWLTAQDAFAVYSYGRAENNYKLTAAYGAPCGMLGVDWNVSQSRLEFDSSCTGWSGTIVYPRPEFDKVLKILTFNAKDAAKAHTHATTNLLLSYTQVDDSTWTCTINPTDPLMDGVAYLYIQTTLGLHLLRSFTYKAIRYSAPKSITVQRVLVGSDTCMRFAFVNKSSVPYPIDSVSLSILSKEFALSGTEPPLPSALEPNDTVWITVCAQPDLADTLFVDTAIVHSECLSIRVPLSISAIEPRVNWLSGDQTDSLVCGRPDTVRVWLINDNLTAGTEIMKDVHLAGPDASEFTIVDNQLGYDPLSNFPMDPGQKIWIDVAFQPDMSKPEPQRWADRHATIVAANYLRNDPKIDLTATITRPALDVDVSTVDLGETTVGVSRTASVTVRNTGNAPLSISDIQLGDARLKYTGLAIGDIIPPGAQRVITVTLSSDVPDSIAASLLVRCNEDCADPREVEVLLVVAADPQKLTSIAVEPAAFGPQFTCQSSTSTAHFRNTGQADVKLVAADIVNDANAAFTFADGSRHMVIQKVLTTGQDEAIVIDTRPRISGASTATLLFTWDSLGVTRTTECPLNVTASIATAALQLSASATGLEPGKTFTVPITIESAPPTAATSAVVGVSYRGDLFSYRSMSSAIGAQIVSNSYQPDGSQLLTIIADDPAGLSSGEVLCDLTFESMLTLEDSTPIQLTDARFLSGEDSLCVDWTQTPTDFYRAEECGDSLMKQVLEGKTQLHLESITPNPSIGSVTIFVSSAASESAELRLIDPVGRVAIENWVHLDRGRNALQMDVSRLPSGSYIMQIESAGTLRSMLILHER